MQTRRSLLAAIVSATISGCVTLQNDESNQLLRFEERGVVHDLGDARGCSLMKTNYLFTTDREADEIHSVDVTNKQNPVIADTLADAAFDDTNKVDSVGNVLVATQRAGRVSTIDISNPGDMNLLADTGAMSGFNDTYGVVAVGDHAYPADRGGIVGVVDISDPNVPTLVGSESDSTVLEGATGVDKTGDHIFVACGRKSGSEYNNRVVSVDVSDPTDPTISDNLQDTEDLDGADAIAIKGDYAFVGGWDMARLTVVDIYDPSNMEIVEVDVTNDMEQCFQIDTITSDSVDYAFCSAKGVETPLIEEGGIVAYDISNPTDVQMIGTVVLENGANMHGCQVDEEYAYGLATNDGALTVVDWEANK